MPRKRLKAVTNPPAGFSSRAKTYQGQDATNRCILPLIVELEGLVPNAPNAVISAGWRFDIYVCSEFATKLFAFRITSCDAIQ